MQLSGKLLAQQVQSPGFNPQIPEFDPPLALNTKAYDVNKVCTFIKENLAN